MNVDDAANMVGYYQYAFGSVEGEKVLQDIVEKVYDIEEDDRQLRQILSMPLGKRCGLFDRLRENYPVRREFQNTEIVFERPCESLAAKLGGIGFKV